MKQATWARAVRIALLLRGLTEQEIARAVGISPFRISRALTGTRPPSPELRDRITNAVLVDRE
jgi:transcriptional regulator with XRE-family HTH domain